MSLLHILRSADCDDALSVINAQADTGEEVSVVLEGDQPVPEGVTCHVLGNARSGAEGIDNDRLVEMIFQADSTIIW